MRISIIIPTYNRLQTLLQALGSLQQQTLSWFETIVVDNAADAEVQRMVEEFNQTARLPVRYVSESQLGLHNARHAGARAATGEAGDQPIAQLKPKHSEPRPGRIQGSTSCLCSSSSLQDRFDVTMIRL